MISENIKNLRTQKNLTQKELAELLHVTAQAVSRWENGDVEPSIGTISSMAEIFHVTTDEIIGGPTKKPPEKTVVQTVVQKEQVVSEYKPVLAVCEQCNKPIYNGNEIVRKTVYHGRSPSTTKVLCRSCDEKNKKAEYQAAVAHGKLQRKRSFLWGGLATVAAAGITLAVTLSVGATIDTVIGSIIATILLFPFLSCLFLQNNFVGELFETISSWGIHFPGLITDFSLDGLIWLITVKLLFWILSGIVAVFCFLLAITLCLAISAFVYPFALSKNIKHPEIYEEF